MSTETESTPRARLYRSQRGRRRIETLYRRGVRHLRVDVDERWVETAAGRTHVLAVGPADAPPLLVFHGGNTTSPVTLSWVVDLADEYRLYAPDIPGRPGLSAPVRLDPTGDAYGEWVADLLDGLGIERAPMVGISYGGGVLLRAAATVPERVSAAAFVVPAGFGSGSTLAAATVGLPSLLYRFVRSDRLVEHVVGRLATDPEGLEPVAVDTMAAVLRHVRLDRTFPSVTPAELLRFDAPAYVAVGTDDPFFPPDAVLPNADAWLRNVVRMERLVGERHLLSAGAREHVRGRIRELVAAAETERPEQSR